MYPKSVIDNQIKTFLDKQFTVDSVTTSEKQKTFFSCNKKEIKTYL